MLNHFCPETRQAILCVQSTFVRKQKCTKKKKKEQKRKKCADRRNEIYSTNRVPSITIPSTNVKLADGEDSNFWNLTESVSMKLHNPDLVHYVCNAQLTATNNFCRITTYYEGFTPQQFFRRMALHHLKAIATIIDTNCTSFHSS